MSDKADVFNLKAQIEVLSSSENYLKFIEAENLLRKAAEIISYIKACIDPKDERNEFTTGTQAEY